MSTDGEDFNPGLHARTDEHGGLSVWYTSKLFSAMFE